MNSSSSSKADSARASLKRLASIDIYRGMVMFLMLAEVLHLYNLRKVFTGDNWLGQLCELVKFHTTHVEWAGCSLHDMIQPSFTFLVGVSMVFSIQARSQRGQAANGMLRHALLRSLILVFLGIFLRSLGKPTTNYTFDDTLTQIGLGYWILYLISGFELRGLAGWLGLVLGGYWLAFILYPAPGSDFPFAQYGVPADWAEHWREGWAVHFNKNSNLAWAFDRWWMNLFPRPMVFEFAAGGYATLSFIPTLGTMIIGLMAGKLMVGNSLWERKFGLLVSAGVIGLGLAYGLHWAEICPIVKRIWTPSWVLWSGGICLIWLALLNWLCDQRGWNAWGFPLTVVGANSIAAYVMSWTVEQPTLAALKRHMSWLCDWSATQLAGSLSLDAAGTEKILAVIYGGLTLIFFWLVLLWLYRQRIFIRI